ncbi:MAG: DNA polymerase III subunit gamma/tau, partial [Shimia sp.]
AAEMAIIRLTHVADLPTPGDLIRKLKDTPPPATPAPQPAPNGGGGHTAMTGTGPVAVAAGLERYARFEDIVSLIRTHRDVKLLVEVETGLKLVSYSPGRIAFEPAPNAAPDLAQRLGARLQAWTGNRWGISVENEGGTPTIASIRDARQKELEQEALDHPLVKAAFDAFPGAKILKITPPEDAAQKAEADALGEVETEWDPFDDD